MTDDLVKRLRSVDISWSETGEWCAEAADRIEQHEAFRQEVSEAVEAALACGGVERLRHEGILSRFIITKPDPLVEAIEDAWGPDLSGDNYKRASDSLREALAKRGGKIMWEDEQ